MENEKSTTNLITVYTEIIRRLIDPNFRFSKGGATIKKIAKFLDIFEHEFGAVTNERLVDFCVATAYLYKDRAFTVGHLLGKAAVTRLKTKANGSKFYEDRWLSKAQLSRSQLVDMIKDRSEHPHAKYIFMASEEGTKMRMLNVDVGFTICQLSTLGWSPLSQACQLCNFVEDCKLETQRKYPELYRLRSEHGKRQ